MRLVTDDGSGETLKYLFGEAERSCANALQGEIYDDFDPADLGRVLHDIIAGPTGDLLFREDQEKLPGEQDTPPTDAEYKTCSGGTGTQEQPCEIPFRLDQSHDSFRAFIDLTFIRQGVRNPDLVQVVLRSPRDGSGDYHASPTIGGSSQIDPAAAGGEYRQIPPFRFYTRAQYGSEIQIVGHQAAERLVDPNQWQWQWQWQGEWALLFFGSTLEAQADARRAAATVRLHTTDSPAIDSFGIGADGTLSGFVHNYPEHYEAIELRARLDANDGAPVYATRTSLTEEPLDVVGADRRFELPGFLNRLVAWDSEEGGGNGRNLRESIMERGGLAASAVMKQDFKYGGHPELLRWERDIGIHRLTPAELERLDRMMDGRDRARELAAALEQSAVEWLPSELALGEPRVDGDTVSLSVSTVPGALPGTLTVDFESVRVVDASPLQAPPADASVEAAPLGTTAASRPPMPLVEADPWSCEVPGTGVTVPAGGGDIAFVCPAPLLLRTDTEQDVELSTAMAMRVVEQREPAAALLDGLWFQPGSQGGERMRAALSDALAQGRRTVQLESARFVLDVPEPPPPPPPPPPPIDKLREFWPMLAALLAAAAAARLFVAWRLRPWDPLGSADYVAIPLPDDDSLGHSPAPPDVRREISLDLRQRKAHAHIGGVKLRSRWLPLLLGGSPMLSASSQSGDCVGPRGCKPSRSGLCRARLGEDLANGWAVDTSPGHERLVVWDLPPDEEESLDRIDDASREAVLRLREHRKSHVAAREAPDDAGGPEPSGPDEQHAPLDDPFAKRSDAPEADDVADPFGRAP